MRLDGPVVSSRMDECVRECLDEDEWNNVWVKFDGPVDEHLGR